MNVSLDRKGWTVLLCGLAVGWAGGWLGFEFQDRLHPFIGFAVANFFLPGALLVAVGAFFAGAVVVDRLWTLAMWWWLRHKHQREIRARLLSGAGPASESR